MATHAQITLEGLTPTEFALLEFTNDGAVERPEYRPTVAKQPVVLTTKASYLWPATLSAIVADRPSIESDRIIHAYRASLFVNAEEISTYYTEFQPHWAYHLHEELHLHGVHAEFCHRLRIDTIRTHDLAECSYQSLLRARFIEDAIFTTVFGWPLAVVGFIPYGFTTKTRRGWTVHQRIVALLREYEQTLQGDERTIRVEFRLWKIIRAFKRALAEVMEDHQKGTTR